MAGEYHSLKKQHYLALIKECAHSGKTNREWCSENGIAYSSFMRWQALLRDEAAGKVMEQQAIVPVKIAPPASVNSIPANESHLEIRIPSIQARSVFSKFNFACPISFLMLGPVQAIGVHSSSRRS
ncbi:MAG: hypothetical protein OGM67_14275 [Oscillospiraceae bacterium]|nr:MAG: hypothetical protein OGM67_14275 [Oscillospiraceae bacterium]